MSISEIAVALGINKSGVSRFVKRGMPTHSLSAAQAWRQEHAPPRAKPGGSMPSAPRQSATIPPDPAPGDTIDPSATGDDSPAESLRRARSAETEAYKELDRQQKSGGSLDDLRKANQVYISSRNNRFRAERDFLEYQKQAGILLYLDEAKEISNRGHHAVATMLQGGPKTLSPRLYGQSQKSIERALCDYFDKIQEHLRQSF